MKVLIKLVYCKLTAVNLSNVTLGPFVFEYSMYFYNIGVQI